LTFFVLFALKKRKGHPKTGHEGRQVQLYSSFNLGTRWRWVVKATPRTLYPREKDPIPFVQDAEWATGPSGLMQKISPVPGFDPRAVHLVAICYAGCSVSTHFYYLFKYTITAKFKMHLVIRYVTLLHTVSKN
jgi:hypothetical protein